MEYIIYILINSKNNYTYIGITNNPERRLKQHNCIIKGGAKYTTSLKGGWNYYGFILGCDKSEALSIEKKIHIRSKKTLGITPLEKRVNCINKILIDYPHLFLTIL